MASNLEQQTLIRLAGQIDPSLLNAMREANKSLAEAGKAAQRMSDAVVGAFGMAAKAAAFGADIIGKGMAEASARGAELSSAFAQARNAVSAALGDAAKRVVAFAGSFGSIEQIGSIAAGAAEPFRAIGAVIANASEKALSLGQSFNAAYSEVVRTGQAVSGYIGRLRQTVGAQVDLAGMQQSAAIVQRALGEGIRQLAAVITSSALPALTALQVMSGQWASSFATGSAAVFQLQVYAQTLANRLLAAIPAIIQQVNAFIAALQQIRAVANEVLAYVTGEMSRFAQTVHEVLKYLKMFNLAFTIIRTLIALIKAVKNATVAYKAIMKLLRSEKLKDAAITLYLQALYAKDAIVRWATVAATWGMVAAGTAWNVMASIGAAITTAFGVAMAFLTSPITLVVLAIAGLVAAIILLWTNWSTVSNWIVGLWQNYVLPFFQTLGGFFSGIWDSVKSGFGGLVNFLIGGVNLLIRALNTINFTIPGWVPVVGGKSFGLNIPEIPLFARGGFADRPSIFGEAGPEAAIPLKRTPRSLRLLRQTASIIGADAGGSAQFVFAPVINGGGDAPMQALESAAEDFFARADAWWESKRRLSYA